MLPPADVKPYVRRNKTDRADAKGLLEAHRNEEIHPVPVKSVAQQTLTALHRLRSAWVGDRTARINTIRGILRELGLALPVGAHHVVPGVWALIEDADSTIPDPLRLALRRLGKAGLLDRSPERPLDRLLRQMMPPLDPDRGSRDRPAAGKTYCHPHSPAAEGYFLANAYGR